MPVPILGLKTEMQPGHSPQGSCDKDLTHFCNLWLDDVTLCLILARSSS